MSVQEASRFVDERTAIPSGTLVQKAARFRPAGYAVLLAACAAVPFAFPGYTTTASVLLLMVVFALAWDVQGGQMGYNSLGNVFFFGAGMYISAVFQIGLWTDVGAYTRPDGLVKATFTAQQYFIGLGVGFIASGILSAVLAIAFGWIVFGLRGPYFAIGSWGVAVAAGELLSTVDWVGGGGGIAMPAFPGDPDFRKLLFYYMMLAVAVATFTFLRWLYTTRFGLALNAIRDDEEKAEAMGIHTTRYKTLAWTISAFFLGFSGAIFGNIVAFIDPRNVAFPTLTFGIYMVLMVLLGGKGTLWGPIIGAVVFYVIKEVTWTYFLGWQNIVLGGLIIVIVIVFEQGIVGSIKSWRPEWFGIRIVDRDELPARAALAKPSKAEATE